jgi:hypothetical protein
MERKYTSLLYSVPSFWSGVARVVDFGAVLDQYNTSESREESDLRAVASDWYAVGSDLHHSMRGYAETRRADASRGTGAGEPSR